MGVFQRLRIHETLEKSCICVLYQSIYFNFTGFIINQYIHFIRYLSIHIYFQFQALSCCTIHSHVRYFVSLTYFLKQNLVLQFRLIISSIEISLCAKHWTLYPQLWESVSSIMRACFLNYDSLFPRCASLNTIPSIMRVCFLIHSDEDRFQNVLRCWLILMSVRMILLILLTCETFGLAWRLWLADVTLCWLLLILIVIIISHDFVICFMQFE